MHFNPHILLLLGILAIWVLVRLFFRTRRLIGRQGLNRKRLALRCVILGAILVLIAVTRAYGEISDLYGAAVGFTLGVLLALWALHQTTFDVDNGKIFYRPNLYIGLLVLLVFLSEFGWHMYENYGLIRQLEQGGKAASQNHFLIPAKEIPHSPILSAALFLVVSYFLVYYAGLLWRTRNNRHNNQV